MVAEPESAVLRAGAELPPRELDARRTEIAVVVGNGLLSGLRGWFTGYLPALLLACLASPIVVVVIAFHDPTSALIAIITVPLIPLFMILIGLLHPGPCRGDPRRDHAPTSRTSSSICSPGCSTPRALGREDPTGRAWCIGSGHRGIAAPADHAGAADRLPVLDGAGTLATLSVALIAVAIGLAAGLRRDDVVRRARRADPRAGGVLAAAAGGGEAPRGAGRDGGGGQGLRGAGELPGHTDSMDSRSGGAVPRRPRDRWGRRTPSRVNPPG